MIFMMYMSDPYVQYRHCHPEEFTTKDLFIGLYILGMTTSIYKLWYI